MFVQCMRPTLTFTRVHVSYLRGPTISTIARNGYVPYRGGSGVCRFAEPIMMELFCRNHHTINVHRGIGNILRNSHSVRRRFVRWRTTEAPVEEFKEVAKVKLKRMDVQRLIQLTGSEKYVLIAAMGCLFISSAITMSVPFAMGRIIDTIFNKDGGFNEDAKKNLRQLSIILCGVFVIGGLANFARVYLFNSASLRIVRKLRSDVYSRMLLQEASWFDTKGTGELINRLVNDTYFVGNSLSQNLSDGLRSTAMVLGGTGMMIYTSPQLALISTAVVPCVAGTAIVYGRYVRNITRDLLDKFAEISKFAEERFGNVRTVKTFCREQDESIIYDRHLDEALKIGYKEIQAKSVFFGLTGFSGNVIIMSVLYYGGSLVLEDALTIGELTSFLLYAGYSAIAMNGISNFYTELNKGIGAAQRLWEILDRKTEIPLTGTLRPNTKHSGEIRFENIAFTFPSRADCTVLKNFNLTLSPGQITAIVGRSGTGKTTIAMLLLRLYDPQHGRVLLDGNDLRDLHPHWLRSNVSAVSQDPVLFSGSIRENILYGLNPGDTISDDMLQEIVKKSHVDEFTKELPNGLETVVGQRGLMLSGGQKQRVAIARALIKNPTILILDEATSSLDALSEQLVQKALAQLIRGRTVLTIAHRLSTIRNANKISVLDNGHIIEEGPYENLMRNNVGVFKELVAKQAFISKMP